MMCLYVSKKETTSGKESSKYLKVLKLSGTMILVVIRNEHITKQILQLL